MLKRTVEISTAGIGLRVQDAQLLVSRDGQLLSRIPIEDIGALVIDTTACTYTHSALVATANAGGVVVLCDEAHRPAGMFLPQVNTLQAQRLAAQVVASKPLGKRLWKQLVQAKLRAQAWALPPNSPAKERLLQLARKVRSGDPENAEAQGARMYWPALFGNSFRRGVKEMPPNGLLNYGYAVLRAAVARAICASGLHPSLGLHHKNRSNLFCLADDLMEPLRPLVDQVVQRLFTEGAMQLNRQTKRPLLEVLTMTVTMDDTAGPLGVALQGLATSLVRCYEGQARVLEIPRPWT